MPLPIETYDSPVELAQAYLNNLGVQTLRNASPDEIQLALHAPASVANWIHAFHPELANKASLHIGLLGPHMSPSLSLDEGRWLQAVPFCLGNPEQTFHVTIVGTPLDDIPSTRARKEIKHLSGATFLDARAADTREFIRHGEVDVWILTHPLLLGEGTEYVIPGGVLDQIVQQGKPLGVFSTCVGEYTVERGFLLANGFAVDKPEQYNKFCYAFPELSLGWAHTMWEVAPQARTRPIRVDQERLAQFVSFSAVAQYSMLQTGRLPDPTKWGTTQQLAGLSGATFEVVQLSEDWFYDLEVGVILAKRPKAAPVPYVLLISELELQQVLEQHSIEAYNPHAPLLERMLWATSVVHAVLDSMARSADDDDDDDDDAPYSEDSSAAELHATALQVMETLEEFHPQLKLQIALIVAAMASAEIDAAQRRPDDEVSLYQDLLDRDLMAAALGMLEDYPEFVNIENDDGLTILTCSLINNDVETATQVLQGYDASFDEEGSSAAALIHAALMDCAEEDKVNIVQMLLDKGADADEEDDEGETALQVVLAQDDLCWPVVKLLAEAGGTFEADALDRDISQLCKGAPRGMKALLSAAAR